MQKLFLNLTVGQRTVVDLNGAEFDTLNDAKIDAIISVRQIAGDQLLHGVEPSPIRIDILDAEGQVLAAVQSDEVIDPQAELPRQIGRRQAEGIAAAKAKGGYKGRRPFRSFGIKKRGRRTRSWSPCFLMLGALKTTTYRATCL